VARRLLPGEATRSGDGPQAAPLAVAGAEGLLVSYAHCCYPLPGDPILAFLSSGRGIVIHRDTCANVTDYRKHPENWLPVNWQPSEGRFFLTDIRVDAVNRMGLLAALSAAISGTQTNISSVKYDHHESETATMVFLLEVRDRDHLARVVREVRRMSDVLRVVRTIAGQSHHQESPPP
jgi:guanosine-3',5'-bis(diphosphate) 3'-pyrophosphohydrolase